MKQIATPLLAGGMACVLGLTGPAAAAGWEDLLAKLYPAAKAEGEIIFNTERQEEVGGKDGLAQFAKRFPGIKVSFNGIAGATLPSRLTLEAKAGKVTIDAFRSDPSRAAPLVEKDILAKLDIKQITDQPVTQFFDGRFFKVSDHISNFAYNTDLVKPADRPKRYEDLTDPKWERRIVLDARGGEVAHLLSNHIWEDGKFWGFIKDLKARKPLWTSRNTEAMSKLTSGEGYIGTGSYVAIEDLKKQGAPVEFLFLSPALAQVRGVGILEGASHPNAARLFLGWLLSPEGLKARDANDVSTITPGTALYDKVKASGAQILNEETIEQIKARDAVAQKITAEWGVLAKEPQ